MDLDYPADEQFEEGDDQRPSPRTCEQHGLRYDPSTAGGCVLCRREGALEDEPAPAPRVASKIRTALGGTALALCLLESCFVFFPEVLGLGQSVPVLGLGLRVAGGRAPVAMVLPGSIAEKLAKEVPVSSPTDGVRNASVVIETASVSGSGLFVTTDCQVLSHRSVLGDGNAPANEISEVVATGGGKPRLIEDPESVFGKIEIVTANARAYAPASVKIDDVSGFALLTIENNQCPVAPGLNINQFTSSMQALGSSRTGDYRHETYPVAYLGTLSDAFGRRWIRTSVPVADGAIGAPLLSADGAVLGLQVRLRPSDKSNGFVPQAAGDGKLQEGYAIPIAALAVFGLTLPPARKAAPAPAEPTSLAAVLDERPKAP